MASPRQDLDSQRVPTSLLSSIRELSQHGTTAEKEKSNLKLPPLAVITASQVSSIKLTMLLTIKLFRPQYQLMFGTITNKDRN